MMTNKNNRKNPIAKDLRSAKYSKRIVKARKGRGSYTRKNVNVSD